MKFYVVWVCAEKHGHVCTTSGYCNLLGTCKNPSMDLITIKLNQQLQCIILYLRSVSASSFATFSQFFFVGQKSKQEYSGITS